MRWFTRSRLTWRSPELWIALGSTAILLIVGGLLVAIFVEIRQDAYNDARNRLWRELHWGITVGQLRGYQREGADVNERGEHGRTPLMYAAELDNVQAAKALVAVGARLDLTDADGRSALALARMFGSRQVAAYLARIGAPDIRQSIRRTGKAHRSIPPLRIGP